MSAASTFVVNVLVVVVTCVLPSLASGGRSLLLLPASNHSSPNLRKASAAALLPDFPVEASAPSDDNGTLGLDSLVSTAVQQSNLDSLLHPVQDRFPVMGATSAWQGTTEEAEIMDASTRDVITSLPPSTPILVVGLNQSASKPREAASRYYAQAPPHTLSLAQKAAAGSQAWSKSKSASPPTLELRRDQHHHHEHHERKTAGG